MKFLHAAAFAVILTVAGAPMLSAQEPQQDKDKPKQQEEEKKKQPPAPKEKPQTKPDERPKSEPQPDREKSKQDTDKQKHQQKEQEKATKQSTSEASRSVTSQHGSRTNVRRIPPEHFRANFGREHHFHVQRSGDRHFRYGGYSFELVEVWPAEWSYDDECYIEEDGDDYYLVDVIHPEIRVLVVIVG